MLASDLRRDIIIVLSVKLLLILLAGIFAFGPHQRPNVDAASLQHRLLDYSDR